MLESKETALKTVTVKRDRLKKALEANKEKHQRDYEEAMAAFAERRAALVSEVVNAASAWADEPTSATREKAFREAFYRVQQQPQPESHVREYERAIQLADWEVAEEIELSINDFNCYVVDEWDWKDTFRHSYLANSEAL